MFAKSDKTILVDCDGVLLDWEYAFDSWMNRHGYTIVQDGVYEMNIKYGMDKVEMKRLIRMFNESAQIRKLPPLRDAIKYVKKLHEEHGYVFHCISSLSTDPYSQHLRTKNLRETFGDTVFEQYVYLDTGADKHEALDEYAGSECYWVEDKPENAEVGAVRGLKSLLMNHGHNQLPRTNALMGAVTRVSCWKEIYKIITGE